MGKRESKAAREARELAELERRVRDIYAGAFGEARHPDDMFVAASELARIVPVMSELWCRKDEDVGVSNEWMFGPRALEHYDTPEKCAAFLYEHGIRANSDNFQ